MQRKILEEIISKQSERKSLAYVINTENADEFIFMVEAISQEVLSHIKTLFR